MRGSDAGDALRQTRENREESFASGGAGYAEDQV